MRTSFWCPSRPTSLTVAAWINIKVDAADPKARGDRGSIVGIEFEQAQPFARAARRRAQHRVDLIGRDRTRGAQTSTSTGISLFATWRPKPSSLTSMVWPLKMG